MNTGSTRVSIGERLRDLLAGIRPPRSQGWLATESGVPTSTISRIFSGDRQPTAEVLECLAPVLGVDVAILVQGTDAEERFAESKAWIRRKTYDDAVRKLGEYEVRANDLERQVEVHKTTADRERVQRTQAQRDLLAVQGQLEIAQRALTETRRLHAVAEAELKRYKDGFRQAYAEVVLLRKRLKELADALRATQRTTTTAAVLAGIAALTGAVTVAHYLTADDNTEEPGTTTGVAEDRERRKKRRHE